jgi:hypothetical protein
MRRSADQRQVGSKLMRKVPYNFGEQNPVRGADQTSDCQRMDLILREQLAYAALPNVYDLHSGLDEGEYFVTHESIAQYDIHLLQQARRSHSQYFRARAGAYQKHLTHPSAPLRVVAR